MDPWALVDLGAWLSVAALWGATHFARWGERTWGNTVWVRTLWSSVGATVAAAPITAAALGNVALVGIGLNFVAIPLAALAVPGLLFSLLALPLSPQLASALASGAGLGLQGLDALAGAGAALPGGHLTQVPEPVSALPWVIVLGLGLWGTGRAVRAPLALARWMLAVALASWGGVAGWLARSANTPSGLTLHFLSVGQGDGAVIRTPGGRWVVVDAGPRTDRDDAGRRILAPFLARAGVHRLAALVLSHAHADHLGGVAAVLERYPADLVIEPGETIADPMYLEFLDEVASEGTPWLAGRAGQGFELDSVRFTVLHPDTTWSEWGEDLNEDSVVLLVQYGEFQALFSGDAGFHAEGRLAGRVGPVDLLKAGHHGSCTATGDRWLEQIRPRAAVVSVGAVNRYGHPCPATLHRLAEHGVAVWRTDREGDVTVSTDGRRMRIEGRRGVEAYDVGDGNP
jgi:competence protein ComEC